MGKGTEAPGPRVREYELIGGPFCGDFVEVEDPPTARIRVHDCQSDDCGYYHLEQYGDGVESELVYVWG